MTDLYLNLRGEYFDQIKAGEKILEYRLDNEYWQKRLVLRDYDRLIIRRGYPQRDDADKTLVMSYRGFFCQSIRHDHFGPDPVEVFSIHCDYREQRIS